MTCLGSLSINTRIWFYILLLVQLPVVNLLAHVQLDYPKGGETFEAGEVVSVHWREIIPHILLNWDLYFSSDGGTSWQVINEDISAEQTSYQWTVPEIATEQARIMIVQDNQNADYDDVSGDFTITAAPASVQTGNDIPVNFVLRIRSSVTSSGYNSRSKRQSK